MLTVARLNAALAGADGTIHRLVDVWRDARRGCLQFQLDLHGAGEDRAYLRDTVLPENEVWVAEVDGSLAGFIAFGGGWVNHLYVAASFQGRGVGTALLAVAMRAHPRLQLWVFEVNAPAIRFYERRGFRAAERTDGASNEARRPDVRMVLDRPTSAIVVRAFSPAIDDVGTLTELLHRAYAPLAARGLRFLATHQTPATTLRRIEGSECYLAERGGQLVGTITFRPAAATGGCPFYDRPEVASFGQFAVEPAAQRGGIGSALLAFVERRAADTGAAELALDTAEPAADLIAFYARRGYRIVGRAQWSDVNYASVIMSKGVRGLAVT